MGKRRPTLRTERLVLRPFRPSDAADVQLLAGAPEIADTTLSIPHPYEDGMAEAWIAGHRDRFGKGEEVVFAVQRLEDGALIGSIGLRLRQDHQRGELGYWIGRPYWGQGYCTEAARAVLRWAFRSMRLNRVYACHFARNPASGRVMQKLGMRREGLLRAHVRKAEGFEDLVYYGMLRSDYAAAPAAEGEMGA